MQRSQRRDLSTESAARRSCYQKPIVGSCDCPNNATKRDWTREYHRSSNRDPSAKSPLVRCRLRFVMVPHPQLRRSFYGQPTPVGWRDSRRCFSCANSGPLAVEQGQRLTSSRKNNDVTNSNAEINFELRRATTCSFQFLNSVLIFVIFVVFCKTSLRPSVNPDV